MKREKLEDQDRRAMIQAWVDYPSQDNEGFRPDRGGFKCGWAAALEYERERVRPKRPKRRKGKKP